MAGPDERIGGGSRRSRDRERSRPYSRSRTRSRSRRRDRSRSREISRSVSRELLRGEDQVGEIAKIVQEQQEVLLDLFREHKEEVDTKLQTRARRFSNRQIEKQFELNSTFLDLAKKSLISVQNGRNRRAERHLEGLVSQLESHEEDLLIADASPHGWLAVNKPRQTKELPKQLRKRLAEVDRLLSSQKEDRQDGAFKKKPPRVPGEGAGPVYRRPERRITPEEALFSASKQLRAGACSHCHKELHFYRECPEFWKKVQAAREAKAKEPHPPPRMSKGAHYGEGTSRARTTGSQHTSPPTPPPQPLPSPPPPPPSTLLLPGSGGGGQRLTGWGHRWRRQLSSWEEVVRRFGIDENRYVDFAYLCYLDLEDKDIGNNVRFQLGMELPLIAGRIKAH